MDSLPLYDDIRLASRMELLPLEELLAQGGALMKEEPEEKLMIAAGRPTQSKHVHPTVGHSATIKGYK